MQDLLDVYYHDTAMKAIFTKVTTEGSITVELIKNIHAICFPCVTQVKDLLWLLLVDVCSEMYFASSFLSAG